MTPASTLPTVNETSMIAACWIGRGPCCGRSAGASEDKSSAMIAVWRVLEELGEAECLRRNCLQAGAPAL